MKDALVRRTWITLSSAVIVGCLLALVSVQPAQARRWAMIDGIGPRPALDVEDGLSYCLDGMQIGVALPSAGILNIQISAAGVTRFEGDLTVDLPVSLGEVTHENGDTYYYEVSDYYKIPWTQALSTATSATMRLRLGSEEWYRTIQIRNCRMLTSTPTAGLLQIGPGSTSPLVSDGLVFQATARDAAVGPNNRDGIYAVEMQIEDAAGKRVFDKLDSYAGAICGFGSYQACEVWSFADHSLRWPSGQPIQSGPHKLVLVMHTLRGVQQRMTWDIFIGEKKAKSYRTNTAPTLDGDLSEWGGDPEVVLNSRTALIGLGYPVSAANSSATVRSMWTSGYLYFAVSVTDDKIWNDGPQPWRDDEIEIGIDGAHDGVGTGADDHQYTANPDGRQTDQGAATTAFQLKTRTRIDGWDAEFAIPVGQMKAGALVAGKIFGFNLSLRDDDNGGDGDRQQLWAGTTTYRVEPAWGTLTLVSNPAAIISPPPMIVPAPPGGTVTLQAGLNGNSGVRDTFIDKAAPDTNNGASGRLRLQDWNSPSARSALLRFDLSAVPAGAKVFRATLSLRTAQRSDTKSLYADVRRLTRDWAEADATWVNARAGVPWQQPGAMGANDIAGSYVTGQNIWAAATWFSFDVTPLVRGWVERTWPNYGLILRGMTADGSSQLTYDFVSSNAVDASGSLYRVYRPELIISYWSKNRVYLPIVVR